MKKQISISDIIRSAVPDTRLGAIYARVDFAPAPADLLEAINREARRIAAMDIAEIKDIPAIAATRKAYRALGKEPARYRPSAEALYRRLAQGKGLYQISNIVDTINLASIITGYSIGGYDFAKISGDILFDVGREDDIYEAIGRGIINIENLPVFRDDLGPFGSPTTDSVRTMITEDTKEVFLIVINFGIIHGFQKDLDKIAGLLMQYTNARDVNIQIIE